VTSKSLSPLRKKVPVFLAAWLLLCGILSAQPPKIKVIADQDSAGPLGTNVLSPLMLLPRAADRLARNYDRERRSVDETGDSVRAVGKRIGQMDRRPVIAGAEMPLC
jgi:hypothetical protein